MALKTPISNRARFLVPILNPLTKNQFTRANSFQFAEEIWQKDHTISMGCLDFSLFTNILLNETVDICVNQLFQNINTVEVLTKDYYI